MHETSIEVDPVSRVDCSHPDLYGLPAPLSRRFANLFWGWRVRGCMHHALHQQTLTNKRSVL